MPPQISTTQSTLSSSADPETGNSATEEIDNNLHHQQQQQQHGSSVIGAVFNFTNSIIGAGAIGLGGAIAVSGGAISVFFIVFFGILTKLSLDLVIRLSIETTTSSSNGQQGATAAQQPRGSYEDLATIGLGKAGKNLVSACKLLYSFGCLVAYIVVLKDNFGPALRNLIYGDYTTATTNNSWIYDILSENADFTWIVSSALILPLCMLRDMTPLASFSMVSVVAMAAIVAIVVYIYFAQPEIRTSGGTFYENWIQIRPGVFESLGTFVFTFVSQHTVHLVFGSLKPNLRTLSNWKIVSTSALACATTVSLTVGVVLYITFWQNTKSDIFEIYPQTYLIDIAKLLLCITMIFTFPLPFFTCRELVIISVFHPVCKTNNANNNTNAVITSSETTDTNDLLEPLLPNNDDDDNDNNQDAEGDVAATATTASGDAVSIASEFSRRIIETAKPKNWLLPDDDRQLQLLGHMILTGKLWVIATGLAIAAPNLGDVLDLVGCATGTIIAFILPALLSFRIEGFSILALILLVVGSIVGVVGTYYSVLKLISDF